MENIVEKIYDESERKDFYLKDCSINEDTYGYVENILKEEYIHTKIPLKVLSKKYNIPIPYIKYVIEHSGLYKDEGIYSSNYFDEESSKILTNKIHQTKLERYGNAKYNNIEKQKQTIKEKYGVIHVSQLDYIKNKKKETFNKNYPADSEQYKDLLKRRTENRLKNLGDYGAKVRAGRARHLEEDPNFLEKQKAKLAKTNREHWGVDNVSQSEKIKQKKKETVARHISEFENQNNCIQVCKVLREFGQTWYRVKDLLNIEFIKHGPYSFISRDQIPLIANYVINREHNQSQTSSGEKDVLNYIKSIYKGRIIEHDRTIIKPLELDIYIPEKDLAIEFNGLYWHSTSCVSPRASKYYHLNKTKNCNSKGIRLIHILEPNWINKNEICKSLISSALGVYNETINAADCECRRVNFQEYQEFIGRNSLKPIQKPSLMLGLYYNNILVQVASWKNTKKGFEMCDICSKNFTQIIGGIEVLINNSEIEEFHTYLNRDFEIEDPYIRIGFVIEDYINPIARFYNNKRDPILATQAYKGNLIKLFEDYNEELPPIENLKHHGYFKVFNCGKIKLKYSKEFKNENN